jgi:hypothetical protein
MNRNKTGCTATSQPERDFSFREIPEKVKVIGFDKVSGVFDSWE